MLDTMLTLMRVSTSRIEQHSQRLRTCAMLCCAVLRRRALRVKPDSYHRYKGLTTGMGVPFARCLKTAVDIKGEFGTKFCGIIAGDEECYSLFREVFDPVIEMRHDFPMGKKHVTNWDVEAVRGVPLDPDGKYIFSCQLRTARNLRGYLLPPACKQDARRKIEATVVKALLNVGEDHNDDDEVREIHCACLILRPLLACS